MTFHYHIDPERDIPLYQQLVDEITAQIKNGTLPDGEKLPTVQELSDAMGVARGTVIRAYDELTQRRLIEKVQGRGTFVRHTVMDSASRKESAMHLIDKMLDKLTALGISEAEARIFIDLKLSERAENAQRVRVAAVECSPESLSAMSTRLRKLEHIELYSYLLDSVMAYPYKLGEEMDLIVTTVTHAGKLEELLQSKEKLARVALRLMPACITQLVRLPKRSRVGILCASERYGNILREACELYADCPHTAAPAFFGYELDINSYLKDKDALLLPDDYERFCDAATQQRIKQLEGQKQIIRISYQIDEGSFLYLEEKLNRIKETRPL